MNAPALSYVVVTDRLLTIRRVVECIEAQTARSEIELVIVAPRGSAAELSEIPRDGLAGVRIVECDSIWPMSGARATGVRAATAPIVFIGETHSFPHPGFARALLDAARGDWDVIVPGLDNANPENAISWSNFIMDYGSWHRALPSGPIPGGPTWNVAYRRSLLMELDESLDRLLSHGDDLAVVFSATGRATVFAPAAIIEHVNLSQPRWWFEQRYLCGLLVADSRRRRWPAGKRLLYVAGSPLIPAVVMLRLGRAIRTALRDGMRWSGVAAIVAGACFRTAGEVVGYLRGAEGGAQPRMDHYELHKLEFTSLPY